jgi:threonine-phosphate decarboxylase
MKMNHANNIPENSLYNKTLSDISRQFNIDRNCLMDLRGRSNPFGSPFEHDGLYVAIKNIDSHKQMQECSASDSQIEFKRAAVSFVDMAIKTENILPVIGKNLWVMVVETLLNEEEKILIPHSCSPEFTYNIDKDLIMNYQQDNGCLKDIPGRSLDQAGIVLIANPAHLSGALLCSDDIIDLAGLCREKGTLLFVDETLIELTDPYQSVASIVRENDNVIIQRSISNTFAISDHDVSFAIASEKMIEKLSHSSAEDDTGILPLSIGTSLMEMQDGCNSPYLEDSRNFIKEQRKYLTDLFSSRGYVPEKSDSSYILVKLNFLMGLEELTQRLASHGVLILDCRSFYIPDEDYARVAVTTKSNVDNFEEIFGIVLGEWARDLAKAKLEETLNSGKLMGGNTECPYYPCHFPGQDCTFCYCPFNPCKNEKTGGEWITGSKGRKGWSCMNCHIVHEPEIAQDILDALLEDNDLETNKKAAWKTVIESRLL